MSTAQPDLEPKSVLLLVVEDNPMLCDLLEMSLHRIIPCRVVKAYNGREALDFLHGLLSLEPAVKKNDIITSDSSSIYSQIETCQEFPALILSDIEMPGMDGISLARLLQKEEQLRHIPIILLSGTVPTFPAGWQPDYFIAKPFKLDQLAQVVTKALTKTKNVELRLAGDSSDYPHSQKTR